MADWVALSLDAHNAAHLLAPRHPRSSVSRAYYAAYSAATHAFVRAGVPFPSGRPNPPHAWVRHHITAHLRHLPAHRRFEQAIRVLWKMRVDADYVPSAPVGEGLARSALREARGLIYELEIQG